MTVDSSQDCQITLLTPAGRGAIATISVVGSGAVAAVERYFRPLGRRRLSATPIGYLVVGQWQSETGQREEIVVTRCHETRVDIHCHGGIAASNSLVSALMNAGATQSDEQAWLRSQVPDAIQRAAWQAISLARTERAAGILLDQWRGALREEITDIARLLDTATAALDDLAGRVARLVQLGDLGLHLAQPWRVVLAGPPNVGKSSLTNALLGYERSIVFNQPGTTRDVLSANTAFDGWAVELSDTAGYRQSTDLIEVEGSRRAWRQLQDADLAVIVVDASQGDFHHVEPFQNAARASLVVANKVDQCPENDQRIETGWIPAGILLTSAVTGFGIDELAQAIVCKLVPVPPKPGEAVPFTAEQLDALRRVYSALEVHDLDSCKEILSSLLKPSGSV